MDKIQPEAYPWLSSSQKFRLARKQLKYGQDLARRPGFGTNGDATLISINQIPTFFSDPNSVGRLYQYKFTIKCSGVHRRVLSGREAELFEDLFKNSWKQLGRVHKFALECFDGKGNLYTSNRLLGVWDHCACNATLTVGPTYGYGYTIELQYVGKIEVHSDPTARKLSVSEEMQMIRALNFITKQRAATPTDEISKFNPDPMYTFGIDDGLIGVRYFKNTIRMTQMGLSLNLNFSTALHTKPVDVLKFLCANQRVQTFEEINWEEAEKTLKHLLMFDEKYYGEGRITGISEDICDTETVVVCRGVGLDGDEEIEIPVSEYYQERLGIDLINSGRFPCICVGYNIRIPVECCQLDPLEPYKKLLTKFQRASHLEHTRVTPERRKELLLGDFIARRYELDPILESLGLSFREELAITSARVLPAPEIEVGRYPPFISRDGTWDFKNKQFLRPIQIIRWAVVNFSGLDPTMIVIDLMRVAEIKGMRIEYPLAFLEEEDGLRAYSAPIRVASMLDRVGSLSDLPQFLLCILPHRENDVLYGRWKRVALEELGIATQCMTPPRRISDAYLINLLLKINIKLGGLNATLCPQSSCPVLMVTTIPTMIVGIKVCHGAPEHEVPSVVAAVSSRGWPSISQYHACVRSQTPREELVHTLFKKESDTEDSGIFQELLLEFCTSSGGRLPEQIIIFRGGIGETQFRRVFDTELGQIKQACKVYDERWDPKFVLIVAQKSRQTRFFHSTSLSSYVDNVPAGTVVDKEPCHPENNDFYLCAHAVTAVRYLSAMHYHVLYDEVGFTADDLQQFVHALSYDCQRSTAAMSTVAPVHYAHLAGTQMIRMMRGDHTYEASSSRASADHASSPTVPIIHSRLRASMFFC